MPVISMLKGSDRATGGTIGRLQAYLTEPAVLPLLIVLIWACASLPNVGLRSFIYEEGTNALIGQDVLAHGHLLQPYVYGVRWHEKPSLLGWLIAGFSLLTGGVNEWSARLPAMLSILLTALMVQRVTRRYASAAASLFAALSFVFCPLLLQKLVVAEPDSVLTMFSFAALLLWWNGTSSNGVSLLRWTGCGILLAALAMAKGPQPAGFFALGVAAYIIVERRWRDLPGYCLCMAIPAAATVAWGAAIYQPGDEHEWLSYARLSGPPRLLDYVLRNGRNIGSLFLELLPATLLLPFIPWPWRRHDKPSQIPPIVAPLLLYSGVCTAVLVFWPGFNTRYAMPIAPSLGVLAGIAWDALSGTRYALLRRVSAVVLSLLIVYQVAFVTVGVALFTDRFAVMRLDGDTLQRAISAAPAPAYCLRLDTNLFFYLKVPVRCLDLQAMAKLSPPAWLLIPRSAVPSVAQLRPDLDVRVVVDGLPDTDVTGIRLQSK
jgi:4-amino-4-deoxy-L-arabinose transferase-like glycosyltransferase